LVIVYLDLILKGGALPVPSTTPLPFDDDVNSLPVVSLRGYEAGPFIEAYDFHGSRVNRIDLCQFLRKRKTIVFADIPPFPYKKQKKTTIRTHNNVLCMFIIQKEPLPGSRRALYSGIHLND
jgi:hypothetical protein